METHGTYESLQDLTSALRGRDTGPRQRPRAQLAGQLRRRRAAHARERRSRRGASSCLNLGTQHAENPEAAPLPPYTHRMGS